MARLRNLRDLADRERLRLSGKRTDQRGANTIAASFAVGDQHGT
jgi:hypothetical protein